MKKETLFLILIVICIFLFTYTIATLIKNKEVIINDPITYGMKVHNYSYCSCMDSKGQYWESAEQGFIKK